MGKTKRVPPATKEHGGYGRACIRAAVDQHPRIMHLAERIALLLAALVLNASAIVDDDLFTGVPQKPPKTRPDPTSN